jgi:hypothetical protein
MTDQRPRTAAEWRAYGERMARAKAAHRQQMSQQRRPNLLTFALADDVTLLGAQLRTRLSGQPKPRRK